LFVLVLALAWLALVTLPPDGAGPAAPAVETAAAVGGVGGADRNGTPPVDADAEGQRVGVDGGSGPPGAPRERERTDVP
jgi:hypothetical protein